jgi:hypothetical protein
MTNSRNKGSAFERDDRLREIIIEALPYVEAQLDDPAYKKEAVRGMVNRMRKAVEE